MASTKAVVASLKILARNFAGPVDEGRVDVYAAALEDVTDEQLAAATVRVIKTHTGEFIPPVAVIRREAGADQAPAVDVDSAVRRISQLATYNPATGMIYPCVHVVREEFGDAIAYAYATAGSTLLFDGDDIGRAIARREFHKALERAAKTPGARFEVLGVPQPSPRRLNAPAERLEGSGDAS